MTRKLRALLVITGLAVSAWAGWAYRGHVDSQELYTAEEVTAIVASGVRVAEGWDEK